MKVILCITLAGALLAYLVGTEATAADVSLERAAWCQIDPVHGCSWLLIRGQLVAGDYERVKSYLNDSRKPNAPYVLGLQLDSNGGSIAVADSIADKIFGYSRSGTVSVLGKAQCASACFLIFACAATKYVHSTARIGVHSARDIVSRTENTNSLAADTLMARIAKKCGTPDGVVAKIVTTPGDTMYWLTSSDLASMGAIEVQSKEPPQTPRSPSVTSLASSGTRHLICHPPVDSTEYNRDAEIDITANFDPDGTMTFLTVVHVFKNGEHYDLAANYFDVTAHHVHLRYTFEAKRKSQPTDAMQGELAYDDDRWIYSETVHGISIKSPCQKWFAAGVIGGNLLDYTTKSAD
jgi:ATP-dependent protease ClpP protease subunit